MNTDTQPTVKDPLDMDKNDFIEVIEKLFIQEHEYTNITKEQFIENYLVIVETYIKNRGYNPLSKDIKNYMSCAIENVLAAENEKESSK